MAHPKTILIQEDLEALKKLHRSQPAHLQPRIAMLMLIKRDLVHSKLGLSRALGKGSTTIQTWRLAYEKGGIQALLSYNKKNTNPSSFTPEINIAIAKRLNSATDAFTSYKALCEWIQDNYLPHANYFMVYQHVKRKYQTKLKVARKSHIKKDEDAGEAFKKNW